MQRSIFPSCVYELARGLETILNGRLLTVDKGEPSAWPLEPQDSEDDVPVTEVGDKLPDDLDARGAGLVGPYVFPDNNRRRIPGVLYLLLALVTVVLVFVGQGSPLVDSGLLLGAVGLSFLGCYHLLAGWSLRIDEADALVAAVRAVGFPVGHASAQMAWRGLRSRPTWRVLVYSNESPPNQRGLVFVDGVDGSVVAVHAEENPEDWSDHG